MLKKLRIRLSGKKTLNKQGVEIATSVKGLGEVCFEGKNAALSHSNFNGKVVVDYGSTFRMHNSIHRSL